MLRTKQGEMEDNQTTCISCCPVKKRARFHLYIHKSTARIFLLPVYYFFGVLY